MNIGAETNLSTASENNATALVLNSAELESLPDDPDDLAAALQAIAGPSAGPSGGEIYVDGFAGGRVPTKNTIREVRINSNPFSAEYRNLGFGRIEIFTKPGTDKFHGQANTSFSNQNFNSRNPFASNRAPYRYLINGVSLSAKNLDPAPYYYYYYFYCDRAQSDPLPPTERPPPIAKSASPW